MPGLSQLPFLLPRRVPVIGPLLASLLEGADQLLDVVIADVVRRVDVNAVLDRLDLTEVVLSRVDLQRVVREVLIRLDAATLSEVLVLVDVDAVAARLDVDAVAGRLDVDAVLDRLNLTSTVIDRVDLGVVVDAALSKVDLIGIAEKIIDGVDLPEIIRESTGTMASDTVRRGRMQGIEADEAVGRAVDRLLLRRTRQPVERTT